MGQRKHPCEFLLGKMIVVLPLALINSAYYHLSKTKRGISTVPFPLINGANSSKEIQFSYLDLVFASMSFLKWKPAFRN